MEAEEVRRFAGCPAGLVLVFTSFSSVMLRKNRVYADVKPSSDARRNEPKEKPARVTLAFF